MILAVRRGPVFGGSWIFRVRAADLHCRGECDYGRLVGIISDRLTIACYVISSCLAAVAGLILSGYVGLVDNWVGQGFELDSIVAAVIGGVALSGGQGTIAGRWQVLRSSSYQQRGPALRLADPIADHHQGRRHRPCWRLST